MNISKEDIFFYKNTLYKLNTSNFVPQKDKIKYRLIIFKYFL